MTLFHLEKKVVLLFPLKKLFDITNKIKKDKKFSFYNKMFKTKQIKWFVGLLKKILVAKYKGDMQMLYH